MNFASGQGARRDLRLIFRRRGTASRGTGQNQPTRKANLRAVPGLVAVAPGDVVITENRTAR